MEIDELFGLPAHPLLVHIPVVLIPTALIAVVIALWPSPRRAAIIAAAAMAVVGGVGAVLASGAGEKLQDRVRETEQVEEHAEQGERVELPAVAFGLLVLAAAVTVETANRGSPLRSGSNGPAGPSEGVAGGADASGPRGGVSTVSAAVATEVRTRTDQVPPVPTKPPAHRLLAALLAASLLVGAYSTYTVIRAGHSGANATWHDTPDTRSGSDDD